MAEAVMVEVEMVEAEAVTEEEEIVVVVEVVEMMEEVMKYNIFVKCLETQKQQ